MVQTTASPKSKPQHSGSKQQNRSSPSTKQPNLNLPTDSFRSLSSPSASTSKLLPPLQVNHRDVECIYVRGATALTVLNSSELSSILDGVRQQASSPHHSGGGGLSPSTPSPLHRSAASDKKCSFRTNANEASPMSTSSPHHHASRMQQGSPPASSSTIQDFLDMTDATKFRKEYVLRIGSTSPWSRSPSPLVGDASLPSSSSPNDRTANSQLVWLKQYAERLIAKETELRELILREEGRAAGQVDFAARRSLAKVHLSL